MRSVARSVVPVVGTGLVVGLALAAALGRLLGTMLVNVAPLDPTTLVAVVALLGLTALAAAAGPMWKAARVDPVIALRSE
jgi:putative ABC transport system permease protein